MATDAANIATIRSNLLAYLATESASPKPSYTAPNGQSVSWGQHRASIMQQLSDLEEKLSGPVEVISEVIT